MKVYKERGRIVILILKKNKRIGYNFLILIKIMCSLRIDWYFNGLKIGLYKYSLVILDNEIKVGKNRVL